MRGGVCVTAAFALAFVLAHTGGAQSVSRRPPRTSSADGVTPGTLENALMSSSAWCSLI
jgi:hypothetical protein